MKNLETNCDRQARKSDGTISLATSMALILCSTREAYGVDVSWHDLRLYPLV